MVNIFNKNVLLRIGFVFKNDIGYLKTKYYSEIWFEDNIFYVAGPDCPNTSYASKAHLDDIDDLENLYRLLTGEKLKYEL